jgi:hypothetical protein
MEIETYPRAVAMMASVLRDWLSRLALGVVLIAGLARADYQPLPLTELFAGSDLVALGTIAAVDESTFLVKDYNVLFGAAPSAPLMVKRFRDWSGNARWAPYRVGQKVLLFLAAAGDKAPAGEPVWRIRGRGGEGEMPVEDGFVYCQGLYLEGFARRTHDVQQGALQGYRFVLEDFLSALQGYNRCYRLSVQECKRRTVSIQRVCDGQALERYRERSPLQRYLVERSE